MRIRKLQRRSNSGDSESFLLSLRELRRSGQAGFREAPLPGDRVAGWYSTWEGSHRVVQEVFLGNGRRGRTEWRVRYLPQVGFHNARAVGFPPKWGPENDCSMRTWRRWSKELICTDYSCLGPPGGAKNWDEYRSMYPECEGTPKEEMIYGGASHGR